MTKAVSFHKFLATGVMTKWPNARDIMLKYTLFEDFWANFTEPGSKSGPNPKREGILKSLSKNPVIFIDEVSQVPANFLWTLVNVLREINNDYTAEIKITTDNFNTNMEITEYMNLKSSIPKFCIIALGDFRQNKPIRLEGIVNQMADPLLYKQYLRLFPVY
jgi:predicted AAA+ superfamily ATPase